MKLKVYAIDLELSARQKKVIRGAVVTGAVIAALGVGIAIAAPHQWASNDTLAAADLNSLNVISAPTADGGTSRYSVGATKVCGLTQGNFTGLQVGGYDGAKKLCEFACTSPTAHMCLADELVRSRALGIATGPATGNAWYSTGLTSVSPGVGWSTDCAGWTAASGLGNAWNGATPVLGMVNCGTSQPVICCD